MGAKGVAIVQIYAGTLQRPIAVEPLDMTIDTVCAPNVKIDTKQGVSAVQQEPLATGKNAAWLGASPGVGTFRKCSIKIQ
jgi:hypothetical protein